MNVPVRASPRSRPSEPPRGLALLRDPLLNKGTAFTEEERDALGLRGFLPAHVFSMKEQVERVLTNLRESAQRPRQIRRAQRAARPQRGAVLPRRLRQHR